MLKRFDHQQSGVV